MSKKPNGINIQLTPCQFDYLYEVIMMAYELDVPDQKGWDMQTYDNMVDNVCKGPQLISQTMSKASYIDQLIKCHIKYCF